MTIRNISSTDSISKLFQQINHIETDLNTNLLDEISRIALIPILEGVLETIENEAMELEARLTNLANGESSKDPNQIEFDLQHIAKIKTTWQRVYHTCLRAQLSSITRVCIQINTDQLSNFPEEILLHLLSFLPAEALTQLKSCSKLFHAICDDRVIWENALCQEFPSLVIPENKSAKEIYTAEKTMIQGLKNGFYTCSILINEENYSFFHKDGNLLFVGSRRNTIDIWDLTLKKQLAILAGHTSNVLCLETKGNLLFSQSADDTIKIWNLSDLNHIRCIATLTGHNDSGFSIWSDGNVLISGSFNKIIKVWDLTDLVNIQCIDTLEGHEVSIISLYIKDNLIFSGSHDKIIKVWDLTTNLCIATLKEHTGNVLCFHKQETRLFSGSRDRTIKIWDLSDLNNIHCISTLKGHLGAVCYLQQEGTLLFSASQDGSIKVWDLTTNCCIATLKGHQSRIDYIKKEGNLLFSGSSDDGIMKVWDLKVSLEDTLFNLIDMTKDISVAEGNELVYGKNRGFFYDQLTYGVTKNIFFDRIKGLPKLIRYQIYEEFSEIQCCENAEEAFFNIEDSEDAYEKKREAVQRCLLKRIIKLLKNKDSKRALDLFSKLPQEIQNAVRGEFNHDDFTLIDAIEAFLKKNKVKIIKLY